MPKAKTRKRNTSSAATTRTVPTANATSSRVETETAASLPDRMAAQRLQRVQRARTSEGVLMPALVALGCWGLAISFVFFTSDANHYLYGGMAVAMALIWSILTGIRVARIRKGARSTRRKS